MPLLLVGVAVHAGEVAVDARRVQQLREVQAERQQEVVKRHQQALQAAATPEERNAVQQEYKEQLDASRALIDANLPLKQRLKLETQSLDRWDAKLDYWREGDVSATVESLNSEAAMNRGLESFRADQDPTTLDKVMDSRRQQLNNRDDSMR